MNYALEHFYNDLGPKGRVPCAKCGHRHFGECPECLRRAEAKALDELVMQEALSR